MIALADFYLKPEETERLWAESPEAWESFLSQAEDWIAWEPRSAALRLREGVLERLKSPRLRCELATAVYTLVRWHAMDAEEVLEGVELEEEELWGYQRPHVLSHPGELRHRAIRWMNLHPERVALLLDEAQEEVFRKAFPPKQAARLLACRQPAVRLATIRRLGALGAGREAGKSEFPPVRPVTRRF